MIAQGAENVGGGHDIDIAADGEHADQAGRLGTETDARHQRPAVVHPEVEAIGDAEDMAGQEQVDRAEAAVRKRVPVDVVVAAAHFGERTAVEHQIAFDPFGGSPVLGRGAGKNEEESREGYEDSFHGFVFC